MTRKYGKEQKLATIKIKQELVSELQEIYLTAFQKLNTAGLGDGALAKLTQLILLSRDGAISPLQNSIEKTNSELSH